MTISTCVLLLTITWTYLNDASDMCSQINGGGVLMQRGHPKLLDHRSGVKKERSRAGSSRVKKRKKRGVKKERSARSGDKAALEGALIQEQGSEDIELYNQYNNAIRPSTVAAESHAKENLMFDGIASTGSWQTGPFVNHPERIAAIAQDDAGWQTALGGPDSPQTHANIDDMSVEPEGAKQENYGSAPEKDPAVARRKNPRHNEIDGTQENQSGIEVLQSVDNPSEKGPTVAYMKNRWHREIDGTQADEIQQLIERSSLARRPVRKDDQEASQVAIVLDGHEDASFFEPGMHDLDEKPEEFEMGDPAKSDFVDSKGRFANQLSAASPGARQFGYSAEVRTGALNDGQRERIAANDEVQDVTRKAKTSAYSLIPMEWPSLVMVRRSILNDVKPKTNKLKNESGVANAALKMQTVSPHDGKSRWMPYWNLR